MDTIRTISGVQLTMEIMCDKIRNKGHMIF
jgi:hypothetical protein